MTGALRCGMENATIIDGYMSNRLYTMPPSDPVAKKTPLQNYNLFQAAFDLAVTATAILAPDGRLLKANGAFCCLLGYGKADLIGKAYVDFVHRDDRTPFLQSLGRAQLGATTNFRLEHRYLGRNGREVWALTSLALARDGDGVPECFICQVFDVTVRRDMEEQLLQKRQRLTETERLARLGNWELDLVGKRLQWSDEVSRIFEIAPARSDASCEDFVKAVHPADRALVDQAYADSVKNRTPYTVAHRLLFPGGRVKHVIAYGETLYDASGRPLRSRGTVQDITEHKRAEQHLALLSFALNHVKEAVFLIDEEARFHYVNDAACHLLGYRREELLGMVLPDIDPDWSHERCRASWPAFREHGSCTVETRHRAKDGRIFAVEVNSNYFEYGGQGYNLALARDITERQQAEAALRESEQRYREIFENVSDTLFLLEVSPDGRFRNLAINPAFERSVGISRDELIGKYIEETVPAEAAEAVLAKYRRCVAAGTATEEEVELDLPSGRRAYHSTLIPVRDSVSGRIHRIVGITRDVTLRRQHEAVLEERAELERRLSHFAASAPGLMFTCRQRPDGSFHFPYASPGIGDIFGIEPESVVHDISALSAVLHPDDAVLTDATTRDSADTLSPFHYEFRVRHPAKGELWVEARSTPEREPDGSVLWHGFMHDISERKRMEAAVESNRSWLRTLIQTIPDPVWVKSPEGVYLTCNAAFGRLHDADEAGIVGKTDFDFVEPELAAFFRQKDLAAIASGWPCTNEEWVTYAGDGRRALWETIKTPLYDGAGRVAGVLGVARDITERNRLENALRAKDSYQRALLDNFPFMVWLKDTESRFLAVNQPFAEAAGQPSNDVFFGKTDLDFWPRDLAESYRADDHEVLRLKQRKIVEELIADQGVRKYFETYKAPVEVDGQLLGTVGFARDITARKQMEEQLRASEQQFRTLAENSPNFIVRYDWDCRRTYVNPAFERETGITAKQALGMLPDAHWRSTMPVEVYKAKLRQVMENGAPIEMHSEWERQEGCMICYAINIVPEYGSDGRVAGVLAIGHNITALKNAERRLRESHGLLRGLASRRETAREEERKRIAREIHDELGQHLTALRMGVSVLRFQFGQDNPLLVARVQDMMNLADKTIQVVRDVASTLRPAALDMGLAAALDWLVAEFSRHTGIPCQLTVPEEKVTLDDDRATAVFRVIQESLTNVARHSEASRVDIVLESRSHEYWVEVRDNGNGFDPASATKISFGLVGMRERGLMLGGEVDVASVPGRGTAIRIRIPIPIHDTLEQR
ncbi:MAG: PAS domain S-box protein [Pseudogulbenkiania sp.]|nr:PAS domain S-box protein [Pseudogulbenkiania sp.]